MRIIILILLLAVSISAYKRSKINDRQRDDDSRDFTDYIDTDDDADDDDVFGDRKVITKKSNNEKTEKSGESKPIREAEKVKKGEKEPKSKDSSSEEAEKKKPSPKNEENTEKEEKVKKEEKPRKSRRKSHHSDEDYKEESECEGKDCWLACDGDKDELCHCDGNELDCSNQQFEEDEDQDAYPLDTMNLDVKDKEMKIYTADFHNNAIPAILKGKILKGHEQSISLLKLGDNQIKLIQSGAFKEFKNLTVLHLSKNLIHKLKPTYFEGLENLHKLDLSYNKLKLIPDEVFANLKNLKWLALDGNRLVISADTFKGLDSLESLSLDNCGLDVDDLSAEDLFKNLPKLKALSLRTNPINEIPKAIQKLKGIVTLDLSETRITELHSSSFKDEVELKTLLMQNMPYLAKIDDCAFCGVEVENLNFKNSKKLFEIHPNAFGFEKDEDNKCSSLKTLNLESCNLTVIDEDTYQWNELDDNLHIGGNPINCSCNTSFLLEGYIFKFKNSQIVPKCEYPEELAGKLLKDVAESDACSTTHSRSKWTKFAEILVFFLFFSGISVGVYYVVVTKKYMELIRTTPSGTPVHYSNLRNSQNPDDRDALESDFQPRPADV